MATVGVQMTLPGVTRSGPLATARTSIQVLQFGVWLKMGGVPPLDLPPLLIREVTPLRTLNTEGFHWER